MAKQQRKRDAALPPQRLVSALVTVADGGVRLSIQVCVPSAAPAPPDDVDVLANAASRVFDYFAAKHAAANAAAAPAAVVEQPFADGFALVLECGWAKPGAGAFSVIRFTHEPEARAAAAKLWCNWVLYKEEGVAYTEVSSGGVGFACSAIRQYVSARMEAAKREARRLSRGEPAPAAVDDAEADLDPAQAWYDT